MENQSIEQYLANINGVYLCPLCSFQFVMEENLTEEEAKAKLQILLGRDEVPMHMIDELRLRVTCHNEDCLTDFCIQCRTSPYHNTETCYISETFRKNTAKEHIMKTIPCHYKYYLEIVDKSSLTNVILNWDSAPDTPVFYNNGTYYVKGWRVHGVPQKKTGEMLIERDSQYTVARSEQLIPYDDEILSPWYHDSTIVWRSEQISKQLDRFFQQSVPGMRETYENVFSEIIRHHIPVFIVGGTVRDLIQNLGSGINYVPKDIDIGFGGDAEELYKIGRTKSWKISEPTPTSLIRIGDSRLGVHIEGKPIGGVNSDKIPNPNMQYSSFSVDLSCENLYRDFTINSLWYDVVNKTIVDPTSTGVQDAILKILRIPVVFDKWETWVRGNPTKLLRYWLFVSRGYEAVDEKTKNYIIEKTIDALFDNILTSYHCKTFVTLGVMNNKKNESSLEKLQRFKQAITKDIGEDLYHQFFGDE
jgi:hypothetical protein